MRCFISIELPDNVKSQIFNTFEKLRNSETCYGNFIREKNMQLTLKFIKKFPAEKIDLIKQALKEVDFRQFPVETGEVGFFPNDQNVKIIWIDLVASEFDFLREEIDRKLNKIGLNENERKFIPHLTVVRIKRIKDRQSFFNKVKEIAPRKMFFIANHFSLVKSILKRKGPEYTILNEFQMRMR